MARYPLGVLMLQTAAFVLNRIERGEADFLVSLFTKERGLIRGIAQGVRKPAAKLKGHLEPCTKTDVTFVPGRTYHRLIGAEMIDAFPKIRQAESRRRAAAEAGLLVEKIALEENDPGIWTALENFFDYLASDSGYDPQLAFFWLSVRLLKEVGYQISEEFKRDQAIRELFFCGERELPEQFAARAAQKGAAPAAFAALSQAYLRHCGFSLTAESLMWYTRPITQ